MVDSTNVTWVVLKLIDFWVFLKTKMVDSSAAGSLPGREAAPRHNVHGSLFLLIGIDLIGIGIDLEISCRDINLLDLEISDIDNI